MTAAGAPTPAYGSTSARHVAGIITRTALAYSNTRQLRWWLAYLDLPLMWIVASTSIARKPELVAHLGTASTQLDRRPAHAMAERRPTGLRSLIAVQVALVVIILFTPVACATVFGPTRTTVVFMWTWYGVLIGLPLITYLFPSVAQQWRGRGRDDWATTTQAETGRTPILFTILAAWPATGGGLKGTGDGFDLVRALAADARRDGAILICTARSARLAKLYRTETGAEASPLNPRLLRWP